MKRLAVLLLIACGAMAADKPDPAFAKWWAKFQLAVMRGEVATIAKGAQFPMAWENGPEVRSIASQSDMAANYGIFFTPEIRKMIATLKPEKLKSGDYIITWKARGNEYSILFTPVGGVYALQSMSEGPP